MSEDCADDFAEETIRIDVRFRSVPELSPPDVKVSSSELSVCDEDSSLVRITIRAFGSGCRIVNVTGKVFGRSSRFLRRRL